MVFARFPKATYFDVCAVAIEIIWLLFDSCFGSIFFWAAGSFNYLWAYAFILTWLLPFRFLFAKIIDSEKIKEIDCTFNKSNFIQTVLLFILGIFAGWFQELGIVFLLLTSISLVGLKILYKAKIPVWAWTALSGFVIGWLILYTAPGPRARVAMINAIGGNAFSSLSDIFRMGPKGVIIHIIKIYNSYKFTVEYFLFSVFILFTNLFNTHNGKQKLAISIFIVLILNFSLSQTPFFLFLCLCISLFYAGTNKAENLPIAKSFCIFACLFFCITLFTGALIQVSGIPWRTQLHYTLIRLIMIWLCLDLFFYCSDKNSCSYFVKNMSMMFCAVVCLTSILFVCVESFNMRKKWDVMCTSVEQQKQMGIEDVVVSGSTFRSNWKNYSDWGNPGKDATVWPNTTYANYFGVKSYVAE